MRHLRGLVPLGLVLVLLGGASPAGGAIVLPPGAPECVRWAAGDVRAALEAAGVAEADADVAVAIAPGRPAEGFDLAVAGGRATITGGDAVGAMYGLLELAEQIQIGGARGPWKTVAGALLATRQKPFVRFRADNPFCHVRPLLFADVEMWKRYIDMLARARFNVLDVHGGYDLDSTGFPNLYPQMVHVPEFPDVGDKAEQAKNLAAFQAIVAHARARGVNVAFMNYQAGAEGVPPDRLAAYTAKAVATFLKEVPDLHLIGFRVGESGQKADFYEKAYLAGLAASGRKDVGLYTRSWKTTQDALEAIGQAAGGRFGIEIKYNGEQLGLPYHALQGGYGSYSYEGYVRLGAPYQVIWQVRANGTHRYWAWMDTDFIRRWTASLRLGDALGFTLEPHVAYFPVGAAAYFDRAEDQKVYDYIWEKHWMWYFAWGRLSYDPGLPDRTVAAAFERRYGPPGKTVCEALRAASRIVPLALAYRFQGPDHRHHSPETETGVAGKADPLAFAPGRTMDDRAFECIPAFVERKTAGGADGRVGPAHAARMLKDAAQRTRDLAGQVGGLSGRAADEWRLLRVDLLAASHLADYYADRILGTTHLAYALKTGSQEDYAKAVRLLAASRDAWQRLAETADPVYAPLNNPLRKQRGFQWAGELPLLETVDAAAREAWARAKADPAARPLALTPADLGEAAAVEIADLQHRIGRDGRVTVTCTVAAKAGVKEALLWHKRLPSGEKWTSTAMEERGGAFSATVPIDVAGFMYQVEVRDAGGGAALAPAPLEGAPYRAIEPPEVEQALKGR